MPFVRSIHRLQQSSNIACPSRGDDSGVQLAPNNPGSLHNFYYCSPKPLLEDNVPCTRFINVHTKKPLPQAEGVIVYPEYFFDGEADLASFDCAIGSELSEDFFPLDVDTHGFSRYQTDNGLFKKRKCPKKATGHSMITELLMQEKQSKVQPPHDSEHHGSRKIAFSRSQPKSQRQIEDNFVPHPEFRFLCRPGHPIYEKPTPDHEKAQVPKRNPEGSTVVRPTRKTHPLQACVDCTFVPWMSNEYVERDDFILFDEIHQLCTF